MTMTDIELLHKYDTLLCRWLAFAIEELPSKGWYPEYPPDVATASGEALRALVTETKTLLGAAKP